MSRYPPEIMAGYRSKTDIESWNRLLRYPTDRPVIRVLYCISGLGEGVTYPVMHAMVAQWSPPLERTKMSAMIYAGSQVRIRYTHHQKTLGEYKDPL